MSNMSLKSEEIVEFPETRTAPLRQHGPGYLFKHTLEKFIEWRIENNIGPDLGNTYALFYTGPTNKSDPNFLAEICVSTNDPIVKNEWGIRELYIPGGYVQKQVTKDKEMIFRKCNI